MILKETDNPVSNPTVAVVAPMWAEASPTIAHLRLKAHDRQRFEGKKGQVRVLAVVTGVGVERVKQAVSKLIATERLDAIVLIGFAGGLDPAVLVGTIVRPRWVLDGHGRAAELLPSQPPIVSVDQRLRPIVKRLLTVEQLVDSVEQKKALFDQYLAGAVDMESFVVAELAAQHRVPLAVIRVVTDPAEVALPVQATDWVTPEGRTKLWPALKFLMFRPKWWGIMRQLSRQSRAAAKVLAQEVETWLDNFIK